MSTERQKATVTLYCCGGGAVNIGSALESFSQQDNTGFGELNIRYLDSSDSNLVGKGIDPANIRLFDGIDGSGKIRSENHKLIAKQLPQILLDFTPGDFNIILSSGGGGTGSVAGPLLAKTFLEEGRRFVVIVMGSTHSGKDLENTRDTLRSYGAFSKATNQPVNLTYFQSDSENTRDDVDRAVMSSITSLLVLFSGQNHELDSRDIHNFLYYQKATGYPAGLTSLSILDNSTMDSARDLGVVLSVATLAQDATVAINWTVGKSIPRYHCHGFIPEDIEASVLNISPIHFVVSDGILPQVEKFLEEQITESEKQTQARKPTSSFTAGDVDEDTGLVL